MWSVQPIGIAGEMLRDPTDPTRVRIILKTLGQVKWRRFHINFRLILQTSAVIRVNLVLLFIFDILFCMALEPAADRLIFSEHQLICSR